jgi:hypothetical protein
MMKDQLCNHVRQFRTDEVEERRLLAFELMVRYHEVELNVAEACVQFEALTFQLGW